MGCRILRAAESLVVPVRWDLLSRTEGLSLEVLWGLPPDEGARILWQWDPQRLGRKRPLEASMRQSIKLRNTARLP